LYKVKKQPQKNPWLLKARSMKCVFVQKRGFSMLNKIATGMGAPVAVKLNQKKPA